MTHSGHPLKKAEYRNNTEFFRPVLIDIAELPKITRGHKKHEDLMNGCPIIGMDLLRLVAAFAVMARHLARWSWAQDTSTTNSKRGGRLTFSELEVG